MRDLMKFPAGNTSVLTMDAMQKTPFFTSQLRCVANLAHVQYMFLTDDRPTVEDQISGVSRKLFVNRVTGIRL